MCLKALRISFSFKKDATELKTQRLRLSLWAALARTPPLNANPLKCVSEAEGPGLTIILAEEFMSAPNRV